MRRVVERRAWLIQTLAKMVEDRARQQGNGARAIADHALGNAVLNPTPKASRPPQTFPAP